MHFVCSNQFQNLFFYFKLCKNWTLAPALPLSFPDGYIPPQYILVSHGSIWEISHKFPQDRLYLACSCQSTISEGHNWHQTVTGREKMQIGMGDWNQDLQHYRQLLYHWATIPCSIKKQETLLRYLKCNWFEKLKFVCILI